MTTSRPQHLFVISTGRSGTTSLARTLTLVGNLDCLHEPAPELILESSGYRHGTTSAETVRRLLLQTRRAECGQRYCESNQTMALLIPEIVGAFADAAFVWLIRDGRDVVASAMQKQWYTGHSENHERYEDCPPIERAWIDGRIRGDLCGEVAPAAWRAMSRFEKCCWYWSYVNRTIAEDLAAHASTRFFRLHLERLNSQIGPLLGWLGLRTVITPVAKVHNRAKRPPYHWSRWTAEERASFVRWCGRLMDEDYAGWRDGETWRALPRERTPPLDRILNANTMVVKTLNAALAKNR